MKSTVRHAVGRARLAAFPLFGLTTGGETERDGNYKPSEARRLLALFSIPAKAQAEQGSNKQSRAVTSRETAETTNQYLPPPTYTRGQAGLKVGLKHPPLNEIFSTSTADFHRTQVGSVAHNRYDDPLSEGQI